MRKRYVPDLKLQLADCEANYLRLRRLLPDWDQEDERVLLVCWNKREVRVRLRFDERFAYTSTLNLSQQVTGCEWLQMPELVIRLYHDARMAEVVCRRRRSLEGVYKYPNESMHQPDEKAQLNRYLAELLNHCLTYGQSAEPLAIA